MFAEQISIKNQYRNKLLNNMKDFTRTFENGIHDQLHQLSTRIETVKGFVDDDFIIDNELLETIIKKYSMLKRNKKAALKWKQKA